MVSKIYNNAKLKHVSNLATGHMYIHGMRGICVSMSYLYIVHLHIVQFKYF